MNIGDLFFALRAKDATLQADVKKAGDKAGLTLGQSISQGFKKAFSGAELGKGLVQGLGLAGALGAANLAASAVSGFVDVLKDAVGAALEEEASISKLDAALRANVASWDGNRDAIEKVLQSRMRLGFADDEQRQSLALLVAATHDVNKALEIQRTAMDLARLKGISLQDASEALVKVEGGQFRILKSLGIQLGKNATQQDALNAVQAVANGQAEAFANTTGGKLLRAQIAWNEALEKLGGAILPVVAAGAESLAGALDDLTKFFEENADGIELLGDAIQQAFNPLDINRTMETLLDAMDSAGQSTDELRQHLKDLGFQVEQNAPILSDQTQRFVDMQKAINTLPGGFAIWTTAQQVAASASKAVKNELLKIPPAASAASGAVKVSASDILAAFKAMRDEIVGGGQAVADALYDPIILQGELAANAAERAEIKAELHNKNLTKIERDAANQRMAENLKHLIELNAQLLTYGTKAEQISKTKAFLASGFWAQAYEDATPEQAAALDKWRTQLQDRLNQMEGDADRGGKRAGQSAADGIQSKAPAVGTAAQKAAAAAKAKWDTASEQAYTYGKNTGEAYGDGLASTRNYIAAAAKKAAGGAAYIMHASSPPDARESPLHDIDLWGFRTGAAYAEGFGETETLARKAAIDVTRGIAAGLSSWSPAATPFAAPGTRGVGAPQLAPAVPGGAGPTYVQNNNVQLQGLVKAPNPFAIADAMERFQRTGLLQWPEEPR